MASKAIETAIESMPLAVLTASAIFEPCTPLEPDADFNLTASNLTTVDIGFDNLTAMYNETAILDEAVCTHAEYSQGLLWSSIILSCGRARIERS